MKIVVLPDVHVKIKYFMKKATPKELSGFGEVEVMDELLVINKFHLLDSGGTSASTSIDAEKLQELRNTNWSTRHNLRCWIHTHPTMGVFWSSTDIDTIVETGGAGWICAIVFNDKGEMLGSYYQAPKDGRPRVFIPNVEVVIRPILNSVAVELWNSEFEKYKRPEVVATVLDKKGIKWADVRHKPTEDKSFKFETDITKLVDEKPSFVTLPEVFKFLPKKEKNQLRQLMDLTVKEGASQVHIRDGLGSYINFTRSLPETVDDLMDYMVELDEGTPINQNQYTMGGMYEGI